MRLTKQFSTIAMLTAFAMPLHSQSSMIREDRVWHYSAPYIWEWMGKYEFKMRFDGVEEADGHTYHRLIEYDARLSWCDYPDPTPIIKDYEGTSTYLLREVDGRVYLHKDNEEGSMMWAGVDGHVALLYDFNTKEGDELEIITDNGILPAKVTSVAELTVNGEVCRSYDLSFSEAYLDSYTVVEGLGNITWGYIPVFITDLPTGPSTDKIHLELVTDLEGNVIYEGSEGRPGEFNSMAQVIASPGLTYNGNCVSAYDAHVTLYDMAGQRVAAGRGEVSTEGLQPGVYIATAEGKILKILVR